MTDTETRDRGLPEDKVRELHDEAYELYALSVALDHCLFSCTIEQTPDAPHQALAPLVNTLTARLDAMQSQLDRHLSGIKEPQT